MQRSGSMATQQLLVRLPDELVRRLRRLVPARARSAFIQRLLEHALPEDVGEDDPLYQAALAVERDERLASAIAEWDAAIEHGSAPEATKASGA